MIEETGAIEVGIEVTAAALAADLPVASVVDLPVASVVDHLAVSAVGLPVVSAVDLPVVSAVDEVVSILRAFSIAWIVTETACLTPTKWKGPLNS